MSCGVYCALQIMFFINKPVGDDDVDDDDDDDNEDDDHDDDDDNDGIDDDDENDDNDDKREWSGRGMIHGHLFCAVAKSPNRRHNAK